MRWLAIALAASLSCGAAEVRLANEHVAIALDEGNGFSLSQFADVGTGRGFLKPTGASLWEFVWRDAVNSAVRIRADAKCQSVAKREGQSLVLTWTGLEVGKGAATVVVNARLPRASRLSHWSISVRWTDKSLRLWDVQFPKVSGILRGGDRDLLTMPVFWGRYCRDPVKRLSRYKASYPCNGSMQFWSFISRGAGLYLATHDGDCWYKHWEWLADSKAGLGSWQAVHTPPVPNPEPQHYQLPYPVVIGTFAGDWHDAALIYREWAVKQPWCGPGKLAQRESIPDGVKNAALWLKYYNEPGKVLHELWDHQQYLRVPMAVHYYRYPIASFDDNYPEFLPAKPGFTQGVRDMQILGSYVMPYTQGSIWDRDTASWRIENGAASAARDENGDFYNWQIHANAYAWMCPFAKAWHEKVFDFTSKLVWDYGVDGVYLDVLSAGRARACYSKSHGHPTHGGNYWGQGNRQLVESLRQRIQQRRPQAFFTTEEICEAYLDKFDAFLTLDNTRGGYRPPVMLLPLFTAVYHDYAIQYGSDCRLSSPTDTFCAMLAEHFVWGAKLTLSEAKPPPIEKRPHSAAYLRELCRSYDLVGKPYLLYGQWLRPPKLDVPTGNMRLKRRITVDVPTPVVRRSLWRAPDGSLGFVVTNWDAQPHKVDVTLKLADYGLKGPQSWQQRWPVTNGAAEPVGDSVRCVVQLPPRSVRLFALTKQPKPTPSLAKYGQKSQFTVLRRTGETWPPVRVEPMAIWFGQQAKVCIDADGKLTLTELRTGNDFLLLRRHVVKLSEPTAVSVDWVGEQAIAVRRSDGQPLEIAIADGHQIINRGATTWVTAKIDPSSAASQLTGLDSRWWSVAGKHGTLAEIDEIASEQKALSAAASAQAGARLWLAVPPRARAIPFEPLPIRVMLEATSEERIAWSVPRVRLVMNRRMRVGRLVRASAPSRGAIAGQGIRATLAEHRLVVTSRKAVEHVVRVRAQVYVRAQGQRLLLTDEVAIPVDLPLLCELKPRRQAIVAGRTTTVRLWVRNVAPQPIRVKTECELPPGWTIVPPDGVEAVLPPAGDLPAASTLKMALAAPATVKEGTVVVPFTTTYNGHLGCGVVDLLTFDVLPQLRPLRPEGDASTPVVKLPRIRRNGRAMVYLRKGERAELKIRNVRVTTYTSQTMYRVLDPDWREVAKGAIKVDESREVTIAAERTGTHFLTLTPNAGSCTVETAHRFLVLEASEKQPLNVIFQNPVLYFYVPAQAKSFTLFVNCGGETEPATVTLEDPNGGIVVQEQGALLKRSFRMAPSEATWGKVWKLTVEPREDVSFHLTGDVVPFVSDHPARLLVTD